MHSCLVPMRVTGHSPQPAGSPPRHGGSLSFAGPNESNQSKGPNAKPCIRSSAAAQRSGGLSVTSQEDRTTRSDVDAGSLRIALDTRTKSAVYRSLTPMIGTRHE